MKYKCVTCGKKHSHYHINFLGGGKSYFQCFDCCTTCDNAAKHFEKNKTKYEIYGDLNNMDEKKVEK